MAAEIRNLYIADAEQAAKFKETSDALKETRKGLEQANRNLKATGESLAGTAKGIGELWAETTGGDAYIYFEVSFVGGPIEIAVPGVQKGMMVAGTYKQFVGKYPLHNVYLHVFGPLGHTHDIDYGTIFPKEMGRPRQSPELTFWPDKPNQVFYFSINTSNGSYERTIRILKVGDKWLWANRLYKYGRKKPLRIWAVNGFPKDKIEGPWTN